MGFCKLKTPSLALLNPRSKHRSPDRLHNLFLSPSYHTLRLIQCFNQPHGPPSNPQSKNTHVILQPSSFPSFPLTSHLPTSTHKPFSSLQPIHNHILSSAPLPCSKFLRPDIHPHPLPSSSLHPPSKLPSPLIPPHLQNPDFRPCIILAPDRGTPPLAHIPQFLPHHPCRAPECRIVLPVADCAGALRIGLGL